MKYRTLGKSGLKVSELCLGTMTFGSNFYGIGAVDQVTASMMVARSLESGVNFFDTADIYSYGESEVYLGRALKDGGVRRDAVVLATKVRGPMTQAAIKGTGDVNNVGLSRQHIIGGCEASLRRLGTDYIDLYQVHGWDRATPLEETLRALDDLVRQGKVRYLGVSNWTSRHIAKALILGQERHWERFISLQAYYSLVGREIEHELQPLCLEEGLGILPWSPLSGGFLTGKYGRDGEATERSRRLTFDFPPIDGERAFDALDALTEVGHALGASTAQVALAWLLAQPGVTSVIMGARTEEQLAANLMACQLELPIDAVDYLSKTTQPPVLYPDWMIARQNQGR